MIADSRITELMSAEVDMFVRNHPRSQEVSARSQESLLAGVPMPWMKRWAGPFPVVADKAVGGSIVDIDGNVYVDFCLGDSVTARVHNDAALIRLVLGGRSFVGTIRNE
jgi:glutamate-1-semialdehyde aminotransferase